MAKRKTAAPENSLPGGPENFAHLLDARAYAALLESLRQPLLPSIRVNPLKVEVEPAIREWSQAYGWDLRQVPFCPTGFWIQNNRAPVSQTWEHRLGQYYIQDAASMLPVELFDFPLQPGALVLDMAASPGGKTTHLAARLGDRNVIVANDSSASRLTALRLVLRNWGAANAGITCYPGQQFGEMCPGLFDAVLLDAPCSMQGLRSTDTHPMRAITAREQSGLALRQQRLLESAVLATRPGGQVVYSTCTLSPEEDEGVVDAMLKQFGSSLRLDDISSSMPEDARGILQDKDVTYSKEVRKAARLWPHVYGTAGFFAARFTLLDAPAHATIRENIRGRQNRYELLPQKQLTGLIQQWREQYSFPLEEVLAEYRLVVIQSGRELYAAPEWFFGAGSFLNLSSVGLPLAEITPDGFLPAHDWMARFEAKFGCGRYQLPEEQIEPWLRGSDISGTLEERFNLRQVVLVTDARGRYLGLAKILNDRLKNMLPRRLAGGW
ncbi:MAG TPA: hypothetical protein PLI60_04470 [Anaerolineaceae bacterium]|nr:hypothetical protein [Anaerolineaceae bacterium]